MCVQAKQLFGEHMFIVYVSRHKFTWPLKTGLNFSLTLAKDKGTEKTKQKIGVFQHRTKQPKERSQFLLFCL